MNFKEANIANFFSLYDNIGQHVDVVNHYRHPEYSAVNSDVSAWPNGVYRINPIGLPYALVVDAIYKGTSAYPTKPLIVSIDDEALDRSLRESSYRYYPIEQWPGMYKELSAAPQPAEENDGFTTGVITGGPELTEWLEIVSTQLFKGKRLAPEIFSYLLTGGHALVALREQDKIIGTALIYTDENKVSGVYLVCVKETFRGKGLGSRILKSCLQWMAAAESRLCTLQSTKAGIPLYTSLGFVTTNSYKLFFQLK